MTDKQLNEVLLKLADVHASSIRDDYEFTTEDLLKLLNDVYDLGYSHSFPKQK